MDHLQLCNVYTSVAKPAAGKLIYLGFLLFGSILSLLVFLPGVRSFFVRHAQFCDRTLSHEKCDMLVGHVLLYRVYIGMFIFFFFIAVVNCQLSVFSNYASVVENGLWFLKWNLFCFFVLISLLIPEGEVCNTVMHAGWFATIIVKVMEIVLLIDFAKYINVFIVERIQFSQANSTILYLILTLVTALFYTLSLGFTVYFFIMYNSQTGCHFHSLFLVLIVILCIIASLLSAHPNITSAGLLQASIVTLYTIYQAWAALTHTPGSSCSQSSSLVTQADKKEFNFVLKPWMFVDVIIIFILIFYGIYRVQDLNDFLTSLNLKNCCQPHHEEREINDVNEQALLSSSYLSFYMCVLMVILHILMVFSDYYTPEGILGTVHSILETPDGIVDMHEYTKQFSQLMAMSIQMTSSILLILLYMWTIVAPLLIPH